MTKNELAEVLRLHKLWLIGGPDGKCADLTRADLTGADLTDANLTRADLTDADLTDANLTDADLIGAKLTRAKLTRADLTGADLTDAKLTDADLTDADLTGAKLIGAKLIGADLTRADLTDADLTGADLTDADLTGADLTDAINSGLSVARTSICPDGELTGWKKLRGKRIARLTIPREAKRSNATGRKCRTEYAVVEKIFDGTEEVSEGTSKYDNNFIYRVGETVRPDSWDDNRWNECSNGIHFFITREEAEACE